jgi:hypothetical protein
MTAEGWAWLWLGGVYLVWTGIFVGVVIFALRTDTNVEIDGSEGGGSDRRPERLRPRVPRGGRGRRLRGAERAARRPRRREPAAPRRN